jgi:hypothetical protein
MKQAWSVDLKLTKTMEFYAMPVLVSPRGTGVTLMIYASAV